LAAQAAIIWRMGVHMADLRRRSAASAG
jgi:hypothetical protein